MIFHAPYELSADPKKGSAVRPIRMLQAFLDMGYEVLDVVGTGAERARRVRAIKRRIAAGQQIDFLYSESSTMPYMATGKFSFPPHLLVDTDLFRLARRAGIPAGVFYRDVYWKFPDYTNQVGAPVAAAMRALYQLELSLYRRYMSCVFLPCLQMAQELPELGKLPVRALPPGGDVQLTGIPANEKLELLYVGGVSGEYYQIDNLVEAVKQTPTVQLTICTQLEGWKQSAARYRVDGYENIRVEHRKNDELDPLYERADIALTAVKGCHYLSFAAPVKLFEYISRGKPIITTEGTFAAALVGEKQIGWATDNSVSEIRNLLIRLSADRDEVLRKTHTVRELAPKNRWLDRATQVAAELAG